MRTTNGDARAKLTIPLRSGRVNEIAAPALPTPRGWDFELTFVVLKTEPGDSEVAARAAEGSMNCSFERLQSA
jgi:hypothetical protein